MAFTAASASGSRPTVGSLSLRSATRAGTPVAAVAEFAFLHAVARVHEAEALLDLEQFLHLRAGESIDRLAELPGHDDRAAIGLDDFHAPVGFLDVVVAPRHDAVIGHEDGVVLVGQVGDELAHLRRTGRAIRRDADGAKTSYSGNMHVGGAMPATANAVA